MDPGEVGCFVLARAVAFLGAFEHAEEEVEVAGDEVIAFGDLDLLFAALSEPLAGGSDSLEVLGFDVLALEFAFDSPGAGVVGSVALGAAPDVEGGDPASEDVCGLVVAGHLSCVFEAGLDGGPPGVKAL